MKKVLRVFKENKQFTLFFILGLVVIGVAIFAPQLAPYDPLNAVMTESLQEPSSAHPFGTDKLGRDLLSRVIFGTRTSLIMTLCLVAVIFVIGTFLGVIAGYFGGVVDAVIMRIAYQRLSQRRAQAVVDYLIAHGIAMAFPCCRIPAQSRQPTDTGESTFAARWSAAGHDDR